MWKVPCECGLTGSGPGRTHGRLLVGHEDGVAGQVVAGAGGVCVVGVQQAAALRGPPAAAGDAGRVPEGAVWAEVVVELNRGKKKRKKTREHFPHRCQSGPSPTQTCRCLRVKITGSDR